MGWAGSPSRRSAGLGEHRGDARAEPRGRRRWCPRGRAPMRTCRRGRGLVRRLRVATQAPEFCKKLRRLMNPAADRAAWCAGPADERLRDRVADQAGVGAVAGSGGRPCWRAARRHADRGARRRSRAGGGAAGALRSAQRGDGDQAVGEFCVRGRRQHSRAAACRPDPRRPPPARRRSPERAPRLLAPVHWWPRD